MTTDQSSQNKLRRLHFQSAILPPVVLIIFHAELQADEGNRKILGTDLARNKGDQS